MKTDEKATTIFPAADDVPAAFRMDMPLVQREYLVNGTLRTWEGPVNDVVSPIRLWREGTLTTVRVGAFPLLGETEALEIVKAAVDAYDSGRGAWPTMSVGQRIERVQDFAFRMQAKRDEVVRLIMWEVGKSRADAAREFDRTMDYIRDTVDALKDLDRVSSRFSITEGIIGQIRRAPLGVALCMGPFNYPLNETFTTLIPALIMGNTVILKPPKLGVLLYRPLLEAFRDAFPPGVVNTAYGRGSAIVGPMMASGCIDVLAFIGSASVGDSLKKQHPNPHKLRCVLGLGAKNPAIILADADLDLAVKECISGTLSFNGQRCTALKMLFVHRDVADAFVSRFATAVNALKPGVPWADGVQVTPLPEPGKPELLAGLVADAVERGARVVNVGGGRVEESFFAPAVVYPVTREMRLWTQEQFGPVIPVVPFDDVEEPVRWLVESPYGQQVSLFGTDQATLARLIDPLVNQVCRVNLNTQCQRGPDTFPFTGRKSSAEGTLSVSDALRVFSIRTLVAARDTDANKRIITGIVRDRRSNFLSTDFIF